METLLLWLFYISSLYAFIPGLITRIFGFRVFRRGISKEYFSLTFDDGPDPQYTPELLDLLKRYDAKATFFVVGSNAERHPELLKRMHEEGHLIGIHNYVHKTNWLMGPAEVKRQIQKTGKVILDATGVRTHFYRPPWGIVNLFDFAKRNETQIVLWSAIFSDWRVKIGADKLTKRMLKKLRGGEVFLLHDCGATLGANMTAPREMLIALERVLKEARDRGLNSIRIDEMIRISEVSREGKKVKPSSSAQQADSKKKPISLFKKTIVALWMAWEKLFHLLFRLKTINPENPLMHFRVRSYRGQQVTMSDGSVLTAGDRVMELHIDNKLLFELGMKSKSPVQLAIKMVRRMEQEMPLIARYVADHAELAKVKALYGVSMINRGPEKFGFTVTDLPKGLFSGSSRVYLKLLMRVIHPEGGSRLNQSPELLIPKLILMPLEYLAEHYAEDGSHLNISEKPNENIEEPEPVAITASL
ncbi:polysaccharide deacetylase family protein [Paenibacillus apis]|uniref:NodB homology domain-containing protein n=1 Tax=Paenibacillus apis TaxID=1792174 RepID=A0A919XXG4_9BACL|nr:polysaccharide deacetylase family protein [Paenibacillus apis]GIO40246.1 hypothetical protein J41TS4_00040 [Paenibacillus apis]